MKRIILSLCLLLVASSACAGTFLTSQERVNLCDVIDAVGYEEETAIQITFLANRHNVSVQDFISIYSDTISCHGKHVILHALDQEEEDLYAFIDAGFNVNRVLPNFDGRNLTVLDWAFIGLNKAEPHLKSMWRKIIYRLKKNLNAKRCSELDVPNLPCKL